MKKLIFLFVIIGLVVLGIISTDWNFVHIDRTLKVAFQHARNYPPKFSSQSQKKILMKELFATTIKLEQMLMDSGESEPILLRLGKANTFAYNLDIPGSNKKADEYFGRLFQLDPDHVEGHLYYGQHLSGRGEHGTSIKHLQIAADAGKDVALNMIGLAYVQLGQPNQARTYFLRFQNKHPNDPQVQMLLDSLDQSGEYTYEVMRQ